MTPPEKNVVRRVGKPTLYERGCHRPIFPHHWLKQSAGCQSAPKIDAPTWGAETDAPNEAISLMMKLFYTPASPFVRKCTVTIPELGLQDRVEIIPTKWPHSWGTETVPYREDFLAVTPIARIPALVTDDGECLTESSLICEYLNDELDGFRLCPQSGRERWHILSVVSVVTSGILESLVARRAGCFGSATRRRTSGSSHQASSAR
jgi:hypothetical protein